MCEVVTLGECMAVLYPREPVTLELRVSTSGLLLRPAPAAVRPGSG